jgi:hypothetical protein
MKDLRLTLTVPETGRTVRVVGTPEAPRFVAGDVCRALGLSHITEALKTVPESERGAVILQTPGGPQEVITLSEAGMYRLVFKSRKPEAEAFKTWVTADVLPAIRRFGCYPPPAVETTEKRAPRGPGDDPGLTPARAVLALAKVVVGLEDRVEEQGRRLARVEAHIAVASTDLQQLPKPANPAPAVSLRRLVNERVRAYVRATLGGESAYSEAWRLLYTHLRLRCGVDAVRRAERSGRAPLDEVEAAGLLEVFDAIAAEVLVLPEPEPEPSPPERTH